MARLKTCLEALGYQNVKTYINSGNVLFSSSKSAKVLVKQIEQALEKQFKFAIPVIIRSKTQLATVCKKIPKAWANDAKMRVDILFLWDAINARSILNKIVTNPKVDKLTYLPGAVIWKIDRQYYNQSKLRNLIGTPLYKQLTIRNLNTTRKLYAMMTINPV